jgi:acetyl esterase
VKLLAWVAGIAVVLGVLGYAALELSPWPSALFYRFLMNRGAEAASAALERYVPAGVVAVLDQPYDTDVALDVFHPQGSGPLPTIVWVHGGGFLAGNKSHVRPYLKILAARGFTTVGVGYSLSPAAHYPTPVRQVNQSLAYLVDNRERLRVDPKRFFLAGDSAGAQIAAQLANAISVPAYARSTGISPAIQRSQLRGVILHCGVYDLGNEKPAGPYAHFMRTAIWSYGGRKEPSHMPEMSVARYVTAEFPPAFISAGNADPLLAHSRTLAAALAKARVKVETLFFPDDYKPELPHEYQFNFDTEASRLALERTLKFLSDLDLRQ